ncbi:MAG: hypothetical protein E6K80_13970 [Candidatus Eisenbacteria bacterium]|uniref:TRASH domain-containing protein n=1 Tax=Eiseniibacteriota bacterium TaxID=2212470 RepID=A0A538TYI5_UNCEI|nr:MAG: hypothetical protein E6K80_13970 [Candidatus Eisenbacteria bacterium]
MRRLLVVGATLAVVATTALVALAGGHECGSAVSSASCSGKSAMACGAGKSAAAACENSESRFTGNFDPRMSSVCRYACAARVQHSAKDVMAQPGVRIGKLTQCPVSGVVFAVDSNRPRVRVADADYVTCCDKCAQKLKANPRRYLKV